MQERLEIQLLMIKVILNICLILYHIIWHWDYYFQNWLTYLIPKLPFMVDTHAGLSVESTGVELFNS